MRKKQSRFRLDKLYKGALVATMRGDIEGPVIPQFLDIYQKAHSGNYERLVLQISSTGGLCQTARTVYRLLRGISRKMPVYIINIGYLGSAGVIVFQAGDYRLAVPDATFMVHRARATFEKDEDAMKEDIQVLLDEHLAEIRLDTQLVGEYKLQGEDKKNFDAGRDVDFDVKQARKMGIVNGYLSL